MFQKFQQLAELKKMRDQAVALQKALAQETVYVEENGVKVVMGGDQKLRELVIGGESQERAVEVLNKALKKSQEVAAKKLQEMGGGLSGILGGLGK